MKGSVHSIGLGLPFSRKGKGGSSTNLEEKYAYGVEWDVTDPNPILTRIGDPSLHQSLPIQSQYKGCVANGGKVVYWLDPNDWSKKADGTPSVLDGTDGTVRVHIPKFYGKSGISEQDPNKRWVKISAVKIDDTWQEIPEMLVDAYKSTTDANNSTLVSVINTSIRFRGGNNSSDYDQYLDTDPFRTNLGKPRVDISRTSARSYAVNAGSELLCYEYYKWIFYWAWVIEYANFNSQDTYNPELTAEGYRQGGLGIGLSGWIEAQGASYNESNPITPCGYCNEFGNFTGIKDLAIPETVIDETTIVAAKLFKVPRWRGFDNPFGGENINLDGIIIENQTIDGILQSVVYTTDNSLLFGDTISAKKKMTIAGIEQNTIKYIKEFNLNNRGDIIPTEFIDTSSQFKCDYHFGSTTNVLRTLLIGGNTTLPTYNSGLVCYKSDVRVGSSSHYGAFRTLSKVS